jgi:ABC-type polysaccharide/polyol phosphate export permease
MATVIRGFRWSLLGLGNPPGLDVAPSIIIALLVLVTGLMYFRHVEQRFADVI